MKYLDILYVSAIKSSKFTSKVDVNMRGKFILGLFLLLSTLYPIFKLSNSYWTLLFWSMLLIVFLYYRYDDNTTKLLIKKHNSVPSFLCDLLSLLALIVNILLLKTIG